MNLKLKKCRKKKKEKEKTKLKNNLYLPSNTVTNY